MKQITRLQLQTILETPISIVIVPHKNPDGDAIGSTLALYHFLKSKGHQAVVIAPNDYPEFLKWMPGQETVLNYETDTITADTIIREAELVFTLDFNHLSRTGNMEASLHKVTAPIVMIDHHQQPDTYAAYTYSDTTMSSTCEMVYHFFEQIKAIDDIDEKIATCLYTGIMTDTGSFKYRSTTSVTHKVVSSLIEKGADNTLIHDQIYDTNNYSRLQLLGIALTNLKVLPEYRTAYITLSQKELNSANFSKGDTEGFVNYGLSLDGIIFAAIFIENEGEKIIKISLRSKGDFSVNEYARKYFEGGGHRNAAGGRSIASLSHTVEKFLATLPEYKIALHS